MSFDINVQLRCSLKITATLPSAIVFEAGLMTGAFVTPVKVVVSK